LKKTITQVALARELGLKKSKMSLLLSDKLRVRRDEARRLEDKSGISRFIWMDGETVDIIKAITEVYGEINFTLGRPPKSDKG